MLYCGVDVCYVVVGQLFQGLFVGEIFVFEEIVGGDEDEVQCLVIEWFVVQCGEVGVDLVGEVGMVVGVYLVVVVVCFVFGVVYCMVGQLCIKLVGEYFDGGWVVVLVVLLVDFVG